jgi:hypothetical protein
MFDIELSEHRKVVLVRFFGDLAEEDFAALDALRVAGYGRGPYDTILDLTAVEQTALTTNFVATRGALPQAFQDRKRIYVVPGEDLKLLFRLYASYQVAKGWLPPLIVDTLAEALQELGVSSLEFSMMAQGQS